MIGVNVMSNYRKPVRKKTSRKLFTKGALKINKKNVQARPMRGGIRL
jgi:hypothetical protein